jgi:release factor glutamine methyltransferase
MAYEPEEDSYMLLEHLQKLAHGKVLDMGTGSGILARGAAYREEVDEVVAVDINEEAVDNLRKENLEGLRAFKSNLFASITEKFDVIAFNPPYLPADKDERDKDVALDGGVHGHELIEMFLHEAKNHLKPGGFILMVFSNRTGKKKVDAVIKKEGYKSELLEEKGLAFFEELYVYKISLAKKTGKKK